ncbi:helix-turn-helix domain-containing protein [Jeotgalibaca sp. A122]|uniref:helix-turn-helix domain-containing protein n=1 Tax=Jeotgalibaca sp. A122 TaxID=3457322 RepID=UPI003FD12464
MFRKPENPSIIKRFLPSYLLVLAIPLLASFFIYQININQLKKNANENSMILLNQTRDMFEQKNAEIESFVQQLFYNPEIQQLSKRLPTDQTQIPTDINRVVDRIAPYWYANQLFSNFYIYFNNLNVIVSPDGAYIRPNDFFESHSYEGLDYATWQRAINQEDANRKYLPFKNVTIHGKKEGFIPYVHTLHSLNEGVHTNLVVMINVKETLSHLNHVSANYDGTIFIFDNQKQLLLKDGETDAIPFYDEEKDKFVLKEDSDDFLIIKTESQNNGWQYVAVLPQEAVLQDANAIRNVSLLIAGITVALGLLFVYVFAYQSSLPLSKVLAALQASKIEAEESPYDFIHKNVVDVVNSNKRLKAQIDDQLPLLRDSLIRKLVTGELAFTKSTQELLEQAEIQLAGPYGYVGIVSIVHLLDELDKEMLAEINMAQLFIQNQLQEKLGQCILLSNIEKDQVLFIVTRETSLSSVDKKEMQAQLQTLLVCFANEYKLKVNIALGRPFDELKQIPIAYEEAKQVLPVIQTEQKVGKIYTWNESNEYRKMDYYYPIELEARMITCVNNGETAEVNAILETILTENTESRKLDSHGFFQLLTSMKNTVNRILSKNIHLNVAKKDQIQDRLDKMVLSEATLKQNFTDISDILWEIAQVILEEKMTNRQQLISKIKKCIQQHFHDPNLSVYKISELTGISEKIIPLTFKEQVGINLSDYIEEVRIGHSKSRLLEFNQTVEEVAEESGYNSAHSFRRAFKRNAGLTPSDFRKAIKQAKN